MAVKGDRGHVDSDISFFINQTAEPGGIVSLTTFGSGASMDNGSAVVGYATSASGALPLGFLMNWVVNLDLTRQKLNPYRHEQQVGSKCLIYTKGTVVTDMITSGITVSAKDKAYLGADGRITNVNTGAAASPQVGIFLSGKDQDGFAKVSINLP